jgi:hypothetical protein
MEPLLQCARDYTAGMISPVEFRSRVAQYIDQLDRDGTEKFVGLLLHNASKREVVSDAKKLSTRVG